MTTYDAVIVGSGPNGLAAAITLAGAGLSTLVVEAADAPGGGMRSEPLTLPGFTHDVCSAVHPLGLGSPFFRTLALERQGLEWIQSPAPLAHMLRDGRAVFLERSIDETAAQLRRDGDAYRRLMEPLARSSEPLLRMILGPLRMPSSPFLLGRFGLSALRSMAGLARGRFVGEEAPALLAGIAAHAMVPLDEPATASFALVLAMAGHAIGWPVARGGSGAIAAALVRHYESVGGRLVLGQRVNDLRELPSARVYLLDVSPLELARIAGDQLPERYVRALGRFRYGPGAFKVDWALDGPIPWADPRCARAVTVHLSGTLDDVAHAEARVHAGRLPREPFVLLAQPSVVDATRAPIGSQCVWAYCHVPRGGEADALARIEASIERFAPGFGARVIARSTLTPRQLEAHDPNYVGGDINGGLSDLGQLFFRPVAAVDPYATPAPHVFLCSSSTPPGGGVHGMCGHWAARSALRKVFGGARLARAA
jgi:phytoene dehydrogenase-like protein